MTVTFLFHDIQNNYTEKIKFDFFCYVSREIEAKEVEKSNSKRKFLNRERNNQQSEAILSKAY